MRGKVNRDKPGWEPGIDGASYPFFLFSACNLDHVLLVSILIIRKQLADDVELFRGSSVGGRRLQVPT